ncbi:EF-hand calcium-binding domain-containing protein 5 [Oopsacas minuta]|uniref:EF-hand calcium-binding domain-containing protein 5 n=1 Tax=Oopsacas minuta TaxID=111878 RepID=A0AAV7KEK2_9METZ|nr:EF-hand calcium-binding domain-containing protein 5 [Oopsacas minuta]
MAAGSISAPTVIPLRIPTSFSQSKLCIDTNTPIELCSPSPNVKIYYSLNGIKPNPYKKDFKKSSTFPYTAPFTLCIGKHTIKALAITNDKQAQSGTVTKVFTVVEPQIIVHKPVAEKPVSENTPAVDDIGKARPVSQETCDMIKPSILTPQSPKVISRPNSGRPSSVKATSITFEDSLTQAQSQLKLSTRSLSHLSNAPSLKSSEVMSTAQDTIKLLQETNYLQCIFCFCPRPSDPFSRHCPQCGSPLPTLPSASKDLTIPPPGTIGQCLECKCSVPLNLSHCVVCEANLTPRLLPQSSHVLKEKLLCLSCGTANPDGTFKCLTCENLLSTEEGLIKPKNIGDTLKCPFCSAYNGRRYIFCVACGYRIKPKYTGGSDSDHTLDVDIIEDSRTTNSIATQTQGIFFPSSKSIELKGETSPVKEVVKKRENASLKAFSPGNGYWRQQTDHICGHLRSYIQSNADFQQVLGKPCIGRIKTATLHTDDQHQAVMQIFFNLKPQAENNVIENISKLKLDEDDSVISETNGKAKKGKNKAKRKSLKPAKSVDDHLLLKEIISTSRDRVIEQLLEGGANANSFHAGKPILNKAIEVDSHDGVIELLLQHGADVNLQDKEGNTSLHVAVKSGDFGVDLMDTLLEHNGDPLMKNNNGDSVYTLAVNHEKLMQKLSAHIGSSALHAEVTSKQKIINSWPRSGEFSKLSKVKELLEEFPFQNGDIVSREEVLSILADVCICLENEIDFQEYIEFVQRSIKFTQEEKQRGLTRTGWLENIIIASRTCGLTYDTIFKVALGCIYKDNENHGFSKRARCNVGLLEYLQGKKALHYVTASQDDQDGVVGKILREGQKCLGFSVVQTGRMIHIPKILETKQPIHFFYPKRKVLDRERNGAFICCPLLHPKGHVIGVLGIDTLAEMEKKDYLPHEISFYQGVAKTLGEAYSHVELRIKLVKILHSAFRWTLSKVEPINKISVFIVEDSPTHRSDAGYILRKVLTMHQGERDPIEDAIAARIFRKDDVFKEYLFECAENSEPTSTETFGRLHWTIPVRDSEGNPMAVIDIEIRGRLTKPDEENIHWMARLVTIAVLELSQGYREPPKPHVLEVEDIDEKNRLAVLFSRVLLTDLRRNVEKLDSEAYAEIKSYIDPPKVIHDVLRAVLYIFNPEKSETFKLWRNCKQSVNMDLSKSIAMYDPTSCRDNIEVKELQELLSVVPVGEVEKHGSQPAKCLHDWSLVCLSLLEHTDRMKEAFGGK